MERPIVPVFIWAPDEESPWAPGAASRWWLHYSLEALNRTLNRLGSALTLRIGPSQETLRQLLVETNADTILWNRLYEPTLLARDTQIQSALTADGFQAHSFNSTLLFEPWTVENKARRPFRVFTPFWNHLMGREEPTSPLPSPSALLTPKTLPRSAPLDSLRLLPTIRWDSGLRENWIPGEESAQAVLDDFTDSLMPDYHEGRDRPSTPGTSRLSPHLHFGEIGPRQIWHAVQEAGTHQDWPGALRGAETYLRQIGWREFAHHLLFHFPETPEHPLHDEFADFPWLDDPAGLQRWQKGQTGYPLVDAGMRELWHTGWMHNRARMIAASFLVKDLLIPWQTGAAWFWDTLVDANLANNTLGWQWTAGCGADAAPYFRVFNPVTQGKRFDPEGRYIRRWLPELTDLSAALVHTPWKAQGGPEQTYPAPIVDHAEARKRALAALSSLKPD